MNMEKWNNVELVDMYNACERLRDGYNGQREPVSDCPLCDIAEGSYLRSLGIEPDEPTDDLDYNQFDFCNFCPWGIFESKSCIGYQSVDDDYSITMKYFISEIRTHPTLYAKDALHCVVRLERWMGLLLTEIDARGISHG